jgi:hypothetical protein
MPGGTFNQLNQQYAFCPRCRTVRKFLHCQDDRHMECSACGKQVNRKSAAYQRRYCACGALALYRINKRYYCRPCWQKVDPRRPVRGDG